MHTINVKIEKTAAGYIGYFNIKVNIITAEGRNLEELFLNFSKKVIGL